MRSRFTPGMLGYPHVIFGKPLTHLIVKCVGNAWVKLQRYLDILGHFP